MTMEVSSVDWRSQLHPEARHRIANKIMDTFERHWPSTDPDNLTKLKQIAVQFEAKIYSTAVSQSDYLRKISLKMLSFEDKFQNAGATNFMLSNPVVATENSADSVSLSKNSRRLGDGELFLSPLKILMVDSNGNCPCPQGEQHAISTEASSADWRSQLQVEDRLRIVNKIMDALKGYLPVTGPDGSTEAEKIALQIEEKAYSTAASQSDYLRRISLKMLSLESRTQNAGATNSMLSNPAVAGQNSADSGTDVKEVPVLFHFL